MENVTEFTRLTSQRPPDSQQMALLEPTSNQKFQLWIALRLRNHHARIPLGAFQIIKHEGFLLLS